MCGGMDSTLINTSYENADGELKDASLNFLTLMAETLRELERKTTTTHDTPAGSPSRAPGLCIRLATLRRAIKIAFDTKR